MTSTTLLPTLMIVLLGLIYQELPAKNFSIFDELSTMPIQRRGKDYALFFAVNEYQNMRSLDNPIKNARSIAQNLQIHYGFNTEIVLNPTLDDIVSKLHEYKDKFAKNRNGEHQSNGQLLIFFSGHGVVENDIGYFCPTDADPKRVYSSCLSYNPWRNFIDEMDCQHILVAIDACFSGRFDPNWKSKIGTSLGKRPGELSESGKLLAHHEMHTTRWFFSSATDVESPDNSNFAYYFKEGLATLGGVDRILTSSELWTRLELSSPKPHQGKFGKNEPESSFLFIKTGRKVAIAQPNQYDKELNDWNQAKSQNTIASYQTFLKNYPYGKFTSQARNLKKRLENVLKTEDNSCSFCPEVIAIKGGVFEMGSNEDEDEQPIHRVWVEDFAMGKYEVTVREFSNFVDDTKYRTDAEKMNWSYYWSGTAWAKKQGMNWKHDAVGNIRPLTDWDKPVSHVSWNDANAYCEWLSQKTGKTYRLPSEAEWEYAAGGGQFNRTKWAGTSDPNQLPVYANFCDNNCNEKWRVVSQNDGFAQETTGQALQANALGLFNMSGNVWEWCQDYWHPNYQNAPNQGDAWLSGDGTTKRVSRGGSWFNFPELCRVSNRNRFVQSAPYSVVGFRIVEAQGQKKGT